MKKIIFVLAIFLMSLQLASANLVDSLKEYSRAIGLINQGNYSEAVPILKNVLQESPKLVYSNVLIGICYYNESNYSQAADEIKKFVSDVNNSKDGSDKYPLALVYYLSSLNKLGNYDEYSKYYYLVDKYPIPNADGALFTAQVLVGAAEDKSYPRDVRENSCKKSFGILNKIKNQARAMVWFNNTMGRVYLTKNFFEKNIDVRIENLRLAKDGFCQELKINSESAVFVNLSVVERLLAEESVGEYWAALKRQASDSELRTYLTTANSSCDDSLADLEKAKTAPGFSLQTNKIQVLQSLALKLKKSINGDKRMRKILGEAQ